MRTNLEENSTLPRDAINELVNLTKAVLKQNYFKFQEKFYIQHDGLAMGSPLSSILAELFLNHIENKYLWSDKNKLKSKIIFYYRYIDDTLLSFNGTSRQLNLLHSYLNNMHSHLRFTLETESNNALNFLDLTIFKQNDKYAFKIFRKPTTTAHTIHSSSHHPHSHKLAAYNSMIHRFLSIPLEQADFNDELNTIKFIAVSNGYKSAMVDRLLSEHKNRMPNKNQTPPTEKPKFVSTI